MATPDRATEALRTSLLRDAEFLCWCFPVFRGRPFLLPAIAFAAGILGAEFVSSTAVLWFLVAVVGLAASSLIEALREAGLPLAYAGGGALAFLGTQTPIDPLELRWQLAGGPAVVAVRGVLAEAPSIRLSERRGTLAERTVVRMQVSAWDPGGGGWRLATGTLLVGSRGVPDGRYFRGQSVELHGLAKSPPGPAAPGLLDYETHLRRLGIGLVLQCDAPQDWALGPDPRTDPPWDERFLAWARARLSRGLPDDEATRLIWGMLLGWRTALHDEVDDVFMRSGTLHLFAISGLHIALIAAWMVGLLRLGRVPRPVCGGLSIPCIWGYVAATGWQASAVRSAVMCSVVVGTWSLRRPADLINSLSLAALSLLAWDPGQLFQAGFVLSFGVVGALPILTPAFESALWRFRPMAPDPLLPERLWTRQRRWFEAALRRLLPSVATGLAAFAASTPWTIGFFHLVSPVSVPANLIAVPLGGLVLVSGLISLSVPVGTETWNGAAWTAMHFLVRWSRSCADWPFAWWAVGRVPWPIWLPYGFALILWVRGPDARARPGWMRWRYWLWLSGGALATSLWMERQSEIQVFGAGEALLVDQPGRRRDFLLDCGDDSAARQVVVPGVQAAGIRSLDSLLVSHGDIRHGGGATQALERLEIPRVVLPRVRLRSPSLVRLTPWARSHHVVVETIAASERFHDWEVVHPWPNEAFARADDASLCLRGELGGWRILIAPDLGPLGQESLVRRHGGGFPADVLITGIPRSGEAATDRFLAMLGPRLLIVATGRLPATERTPRTTRRRLLNQTFHVLFTEEVGALRLRFGRELEVFDSRGDLVLTLDRGPDQGIETTR
jgi:competence protein ComEC